MKQFGAVYLLCVPMAHRTDGVMKNKTVFRINPGGSTYYCVKRILHPNIINTTSIITVTLLVKR